MKTLAYFQEPNARRYVCKIENMDGYLLRRQRRGDYYYTFTRHVTDKRFAQILRGKIQAWREILKWAKEEKSIFDKNEP